MLRLNAYAVELLRALLKGGLINRKALSLVLVGYLLVFPALGWAWSGEVVGAIDGDSIIVLHDGRGEQIRLRGIDCPEKGQDFGTKAKHITPILVFALIQTQAQFRSVQDTGCRLRRVRAQKKPRCPGDSTPGNP